MEVGGGDGLGLGVEEMTEDVEVEEEVPIGGINEGIVALRSSPHTCCIN